mmetsp:Transcript_6209/g.11044  ORF Transcript_6209/g.11044 Transcript_6209/m.11044 type:complete len:294 (+) Transcript_6209:653-1534(+)
MQVKHGTSTRIAFRIGFVQFRSLQKEPRPDRFTHHPNGLGMLCHIIGSTLYTVWSWKGRLFELRKDLDGLYHLKSSNDCIGSRNGVDDVPCNSLDVEFALAFDAKYLGTQVCCGGNKIERQVIVFVKFCIPNRLSMFGTPHAHHSVFKKLSTFVDGQNPLIMDACLLRFPSVFFSCVGGFDPGQRCWNFFGSFIAVPHSKLELDFLVENCIENATRVTTKLSLVIVHFCARPGCRRDDERSCLNFLLLHLLSLCFIRGTVVFGIIFLFFSCPVFRAKVTFVDTTQHGFVLSSK